MESIAAAASLLTILEAAVSVSKSATEFCRSIRETPDELAHLSRRTLQTHARLNIQFHLHQSLSNRDFGAFLPHDALKALEVDLDNARASLDQIKRSASIQVRQSSAHQRVVWVLHEKRKVKKISENLRDIDDNLSSMLTTWSIAVTLRSNELIKQLNNTQLCLIDQLRSCNKVAPEESEEPITESIAKQDDLLRKEWTAPPRALSLNSWQVRSGVQAVATPPQPMKSSVTLGQRKEELRSTSWLIALLRLPYPLSHYAVCVTAQAWFSKLAWPSASCSISTKTILAIDSIFMKACVAGELNAVRQFALGGLGLPSSIDEAGRPALHHAILSGSFELVKFLLDNGASADDLESRCHVSPLQEACRMGLSDIARLLLAKGAFLEHLDYGGRTALSMLWFDPNRSFCTVEFIEILLAYSPMQSSLDPCDGFGPLPCAAMKGSAKDLEILMKNGAYQSTNDTPGDRIIKYSIIGSNPDTFDFFAPLMPEGWVFEVDYRGRGPLHMALEYRSCHAKEIVQRLLSAGADVHLRDADGNDPGDLARVCDARGRKLGLQKPENMNNTVAYFEALTSSGFEVELDEEGVIWWPSNMETMQVDQGVSALVQ